MSAAAKPLPAVDPRLSGSPFGKPHEFSPEFELLLACCANLPLAERSRRITQLLPASLDWKRFWEIAEHHSVFPQVYAALSQLDELRADQRLDLSKRYEIHVRKSLWFAAELARVLDHLRACRVNALAYKGPALAQKLYGDIAQRQFSDLDIFVSAAEVGKAKAALKELGYRTQREMSRFQQRHYVATGYEFSFDGPGGPHSLEMQWRVLPRFYAVDFDIAALFQRATTVEIAGNQVPTPCIQDLFPVLCVHAAKHGWARLGWLCDIARLSGPGLDWERVRRDAKELGIMRMVAVSLLLTRQLLGWPMEATVFRDPQAEKCAGEVRPVIAESSHYDTETIAYFRFMMRLRERWQDRLRFLLRLVFTPGQGDLEAVRLPGFLFPLYGVVRWFRLSRRLMRLG